MNDGACFSHSQIVCPCDKERVGRQGWDYTDLLWIVHTGESCGTQPI